MWELRCARDNFSLEAAAEKGRELPSWYLEEPQLLPGDHFYLKAFRDLHTCRSHGMSLGPIPWTAVLLYAEWIELDHDLVEPFVYIIRSMDVAYQDWINKEQERLNPRK